MLWTVKVLDLALSSRGCCDPVVCPASATLTELGEFTSRLQAGVAGTRLDPQSQDMVSCSNSDMVNGVFFLDARRCDGGPVVTGNASFRWLADITGCCDWRWELGAKTKLSFPVDLSPHKGVLGHRNQGFWERNATLLPVVERRKYIHHISQKQSWQPMREKQGSSQSRWPGLAPPPRTTTQFVWLLPIAAADGVLTGYRRRKPSLHNSVAGSHPRASSSPPEWSFRKPRLWEP